MAIFDKKCIFLHFKTKWPHLYYEITKVKMQSLDFRQLQKMLQMKFTYFQYIWLRIWDMKFFCQNGIFWVFLQFQKLKNKNLAYKLISKDVANVQRYSHFPLQTCHFFHILKQSGLIFLLKKLSVDFALWHFFAILWLTEFFWKSNFLCTKIILDMSVF